nr:MAG TPA: hypothetical protein [Caudoviricetes sp.]
MLANREREKKKTAPFFPSSFPPITSYLLPPIIPQKRKKKRERALSVAVGGICRLYLGERW